MGGQRVQIKHFILILQIILVQCLEFGHPLLLAAEDPDDGHPLDRFVDNGVDLAQTRADDRIVFRCDFTVQNDPDNDNRCNEQTDQTQPEIQQEQSNVHADDVDNAGSEIRQHRNEQFLDCLSVVGDPGHDFTCG
ncbi:hypothetical protein D3C71_1352490 [compost metagenome]